MPQDISRADISPTLPDYSELQVRLVDIVGNFHYFNKLNNTAAVVKANAYGIGVEPVAQALSKAGAQEFYVFSLREACELREILSQATIYFFEGLPNNEDATIAAQYRVIPILNRSSELSAWGGVAWQGRKPFCVHVDSGMNRLGIPISEWQAVCDFYEARQGDFAEPLILSHLACSEDEAHSKNTEQLEKMTALRKKLSGARLSLAATGGALLGSAYYGAQMRVGIGLYGVSFGKPLRSLKNPFTWQARVLQIRRLSADETIGYGATSVGQATEAAIIACGYADGVRRSFADNGKVFIKGKACAVLGRVSMDCMAVDVSGMKAKIGDMAELIGDKQSLDDVAAAFATVPYEVLCGIGKRVRRKFID